MDENVKAAYRWLLHEGMLQIRNECQSRGRPRYNPLVWYRQYARSRVAGANADWLKNLALFSALDFDHFDEQRFWNEHSALCRRFPNRFIEFYRKWYEMRLAQASNQRDPAADV